MCFLRSAAQSSVSTNSRVALATDSVSTGQAWNQYFLHCHLSHIYKAEKHSILRQCNLSVQSLWFLFLPPSLSFSLISSLLHWLSCLTDGIWMPLEKDWMSFFFFYSVLSMLICIGLHLKQLLISVWSRLKYSYHLST